MQTGDEIWCHDTTSHTHPWFKETISAETSQSWLLGQCGQYKVNKKTMLENMGQYGDRRWYSDEDRASKMWVDQNRWKIAKVVEGCQDIDLLGKIAAVIGCDCCPSYMIEDGQ
jgi:hypothetical protein